MSKLKVIDKSCKNNIIQERQILCRLSHPFIVKIYYAFQDFLNLYLSLEYMKGGDLRYYIIKMKKFPEEFIKFLVSCILLSLDYIHLKNIIHRDIKPENLLLDDKGYIYLTDFGIAKYSDDIASHDDSGSPAYMAPEILNNEKQTKSVDYYSLGIVCFELVFGYRPYNGNRKEIKEKLLTSQIQIKRKDIPEGYSIEIIDFINRVSIIINYS